jgi:hypothetical protein
MDSAYDDLLFSEPVQPAHPVTPTQAPGDILSAAAPVLGANPATVPKESAYADLLSPDSAYADLFGAAKGAAPAPAAHEPPSLTGNFWPTRTGRYLQGLGEPVLGTAQLLSHLTGVGTEYFDRKARESAELEARSRREAGMGPDSWDIARGLGNIMSPVSAIPAARLARGLAAAPSVMGAVGRGAGLGALTAAQAPVSKPSEQEDYASSKLAQTLTGGAAGAVLGPATELGAQAALPPVLDKARKLAKFGVEMTPGQMLGGFSGRLESVMQSLPFVGDYVRNARTNALETNYRAAANLVLKPLGQTVPDTVRTGYDIINHLGNVTGAAFDQSWSGVTLRRAGNLGNDIARIRQDVNNSLGKTGVDEFNQKVNDILSNRMRKAARARGRNAPLDEKQTQTALSTAKEWETKLKGSGDANQQALGRHIGDLRQSMERAIGDQNPNWAMQYEKAARAYNMFTRLAAATKNPATGAYEGIATPTQILSATHALDPSLRKITSAKGRSPLQQFSGWGKDVLPAKVPDSGTPERGYVLGLLSGALPAHWPAMAGLGLGVPAVYSPAAQRAIQRYMMANTASQRAIAAALRQGAFPLLTEEAGRRSAEGFADGGEVNPDSEMFDAASVATRANVPTLPTKKEAALRSFAGGLTAGAWPYIEAAAKMAAGEGGGQSYDNLRRAAQERAKLGEQEFPAATDMAGVAGGLTPLGGAAKAGLGQAVARGAGYGGLSGYLSPSEPGLTDFGDRAGSAGVGALLGGLGAGTANVASTAGRNMLRGEYPFALDARNTLGSGLGGMGDGKGKPRLGDLTPEEKAALGLDGDPWAHMTGAPKPSPKPAAQAATEAASPMMEAVDALQTDQGKKLMPSSNFHAPTAVRFVHPDSELARWYNSGDISGGELYTMAKNAISGVKAFAGFLRGAGKQSANAQEFIDWARSRHDPFSNNPRENRILHSIQDAEAAGYVTVDPFKQGEWVRLTPLGEAALDRFKNTRFAEGGEVHAYNGL